MLYPLTEYLQTKRTYLFEVKSILNKRPLTPINDDVNGFQTITASHLLICYQNNENSFANPTHYIKGLQNHCTNIFWNCWRNYSLLILTSHTKRTNSEINLSKNDLLVIQSKDVAHSHRPLGRILETFPGSNRVVHRVKIKTHNRELIRPSCSICVLEKFCD